MSPAGAEPFRWRRRGRSRAALLAVLGVWAALAAALALLDASPWLTGALALFTLPACIDLWTDPEAGATLDGTGLHWVAGRREGSVPWRDIDRVRLDTRLDLSIRTTVLTRDGRKLRLPIEATPPDKAFEAALADRGIRVERHHFSLLG